MFCECGHRLRIGHNELCPRCQRKANEQGPIDWETIGKLAFLTGNSRAPVMNTQVMDALHAGGDVTHILTGFLSGWDKANLTEP